MDALQHPLDRPSRWPPSRLRTAAWLLLFAALSVAYALGSDRDADQRAADAQMTFTVRRALRDDPELRGCDDMAVTVRGTVANLWGKAPSASLRQRAIFVAGRVRGISDVRGDELVIADGGASDLPSPFPEGVPPPGNRVQGHTTAAPKKPDIADPNSDRREPAVTIGEPIPLSKLAAAAPPAPDLATAVEALRQKEDRYRRVRIEVRQKTVYLRGSVTRWTDVADLANSVRRLPGVEAVILDNVHVDGSGSR